MQDQVQMRQLSRDSQNAREALPQPIEQGDSFNPRQNEKRTAQGTAIFFDQQRRGDRIAKGLHLLEHGEFVARAW